MIEVFAELPAPYRLPPNKRLKLVGAPRPAGAPRLTRDP